MQRSSMLSGQVVRKRLAAGRLWFHASACGERQVAMNRVGYHMKPTLIVVGADKGGVGKTTLCRALLDYLGRRNILARAFDAEHPRGTLKRFYPGITEVVDIYDVADQMKILDT